MVPPLQLGNEIYGGFNSFDEMVSSNKDIGFKDIYGHKYLLVKTCQVFVGPSGVIENRKLRLYQKGYIVFKDSQSLHQWLEKS